MSGIPHPVDLRVKAGKSYFVQPTRWAEDVRPAIAIIGTQVIPTKTATRHGSFSVRESEAIGWTPAEFRNMSYVAPEAGFVPK